MAEGDWIIRTKLRIIPGSLNNEVEKLSGVTESCRKKKATDNFHLISGLALIYLGLGILLLTINNFT